MEVKKEISFAFVIFSKEGSKNDGSEWTNIGYLITSLKRLPGINVIVKLFHKNKVDEALKEVTRLRPEVIGLSVLQMNYEASMEFARKIKKTLPETHITLGNKEPTYYPKQILEDYSEVDSIIVGEGEETIFELCKRIMTGDKLDGCKGLYFRDINGNIIANPPRPFIENIDTIGFPDRSFMNNTDNMYYLVASRGCTGHCTYCCAPSTGNQPGSVLRVRSIDNILDEIQILIDQYHMKYLTFSDSALCDNFHDVAQEYDKLYEGFQRRKFKLRFQFNIRADMVNTKSILSLKKLVSIGLDRVFIGLEAGNTADLRLYGKKANTEDNYNAIKLLNEFQIPFDYGFIMFNPYSDFERLQENLNFLAENNLEVMFEKLSHGLHIHSGTPILKKLDRDGLLKCDIKKPIANRWNYKFNDPRVETAFQIMRSIEKQYPVNKEVITKTKSLYKNCIAYKYHDRNGRFEEFRNALCEFLNVNTVTSLDIAEKVFFLAQHERIKLENINEYIREKFDVLILLWNRVEQYKTPIAFDLHRKGILFA